MKNSENSEVQRKGFVKGGLAHIVTLNRD